MCSILITNISDQKKIWAANYFIKPRGPDFTSFSKANNITFIHNLLSITGKFTPQPFLDKEQKIVCLYNGEIYNAFETTKYQSDGECILPLYKEYGINFAKYLDGEFAICIVDFLKKRIILASDAFLTKPLWYFKKGNNWGIGSYKSCIHLLGLTSNMHDPIRMPPNKTLIFDLELNLLHEQNNIQWDLIQYKDIYDDWILAFQKSMKKRAVNNVREQIFIGMSSGYDSGAIACELNNQNAPFHIYSVTANENSKILKERFNRVRNTASITYLQNCNDSFRMANEHIREFVEEYVYEIFSERSGYTEFVHLHRDGGACAFALVCLKAQQDKKKIYISGSGADEIYSDYGFQGKEKAKHSNFGGLFPKDLSSIFPWASFYGSSQISYLTKEEMVGGSFGIECRYPFLDPKCVQEFLWLKPELKNKYYKNVIHAYLKQNDFPFCENQKIGFWY